MVHDHQIGQDEQRVKQPGGVQVDEHRHTILGAMEQIKDAYPADLLQAKLRHHMEMLVESSGHSQSFDPTSGAPSPNAQHPMRGAENDTRVPCLCPLCTSPLDSDFSSLTSSDEEFVVSEREDEEDGEEQGEG